jgi:AcrR family transcriptional regulator
MPETPRPTSAAADAPPRPSLREEQRQLTRARLREAALDVIARDGYGAATIDEIALAAGTSRATFYLHFKSKADIIRELVQTFPNRDRIWERLGQLQNPTREQVAEWLGEVVAMYDDQRRYFLAVEQAVAVESELTEGYYRQVETYIDDAAAALHEEPAEARLHAMLLWVQLSRFCFLWRVRGMELDEQRTMALLTDIWHDALTARIPKAPPGAPAPGRSPVDPSAPPAPASPS